MKRIIKRDETIEYSELVKYPLYKKLIFEPTQMSSPHSGSSFDTWRNHSETVKLMDEPTAKFKAFCTKCKEDRIFKIANNSNITETWIKNNGGGYRMFLEGIRYHEFECSLDSQHRMNFTFKVGKDYIIKVGQYPSSADLLRLPKDYSVILEEDKLFELKRAIGLNAFGVGVGAFVYLRRIIEFFIIEAHEKAKNEPLWDEKKYFDEDTKGRVKLLKDFLPDFLIENKIIYGILSKGIHQLSEEECSEYFPVLRGCIEMILDEKIEFDRNRKKIESLNLSLQSISEKVSK